MEKKDKRAAILNATVRSVADYGFQGASMAVIASHAGVAAGTIYCHFESKELLIEESYRKVEDRCLAAVMKGYPGQGSIRQRLYHLAHGLIRHFTRFPAEFLFMDCFQSSPYMKGYLRSGPAVAWLCTIVQLFREGTEKGLLKACRRTCCLPSDTGHWFRRYVPTQQGPFTATTAWFPKSSKAAGTFFAGMKPDRPRNPRTVSIEFVEVEVTSGVCIEHWPNGLRCRRD